MFDDRLKKLRIEKNLNMKQTAQQLGIPYTTYVGYEKNEREPNSEVLILLAEFFDCSVDYLVGRSKNRYEIRQNIESNIEILPSDKIYKIPLFESVSAGFGAYACSDVVDYIPLYIDNPADAELTLTIKVKGDSMYPKIEDGDTIVVRKQDSVDSGQVAVVLVDGEEGFVKKVIYDKDYIELHSFNPEYQTKRFEGAEVQRIRVVGLVKQVIKNL